MEGVAEGAIGGALTRVLRLLRQQADHSHISFSSTESPILFSLSDDLYATANDLSKFDVGVSSQVEVVDYDEPRVDSSPDINETPATPSALPPPPLMSMTPLSTTAKTHQTTIRCGPMHLTEQKKVILNALIAPDPMVEKRQSNASPATSTFTRSHVPASQVIARPNIRTSPVGNASSSFHPAGSSQSRY